MIRNSLLTALMALAAPAISLAEGTQPVIDTTTKDTPAAANGTLGTDASACPLSGSLTVGYNTNYIGRGIVISHSVAEGDSSEFAALKLNYELNEKWSIDSTLAYTMVSSGHTLYGNPNFAPIYGIFGITGPIKEANIENEFAVVTALTYREKEWGVSFGHDFIHGGLLGVMAKHYRDQGASCVNEFFINPMWTPSSAPWFDVECTVRYSCQGITGWWFEPKMHFKAPLIGTAENPRLAGVIEVGLSATADYFESRYFACSNGCQAYWVKFMLPYFMTDDFIVTPSLSLNWIGRAAIKANKVSEYSMLSGNPDNRPFRNFGLVAGISCTYRF